MDKIDISAYTTLHFPLFQLMLHLFVPSSMIKRKKKRKKNYAIHTRKRKEKTRFSGQAFKSHTRLFLARQSKTD